MNDSKLSNNESEVFIRMDCEPCDHGQCDRLPDYISRETDHSAEQPRLSRADCRQMEDMGAEIGG